jgi:chromosome segregation ATPase
MYLQSWKVIVQQQHNLSADDACSCERVRELLKATTSATTLTTLSHDEIKSLALDRPLQPQAQQNAAQLQKTIETLRRELQELKQQQSSQPQPPQLQSSGAVWNQLAEKSKEADQLKEQVEKLRSQLTEHRRNNERDSKELNGARHQLGALQLELAELRSSSRSSRCIHCCTIQKYLHSSQIDLFTNASLSIHVFFFFFCGIFFGNFNFVPRRESEQSLDSMTAELASKNIEIDSLRRQVDDLIKKLDQVHPKIYLSVFDLI